MSMVVCMHSAFGSDLGIICNQNNGGLIISQRKNFFWGGRGGASGIEEARLDLANEYGYSMVAEYN